jgi:hypothetical protein
LPQSRCLPLGGFWDESEHFLGQRRFPVCATEPFKKYALVATKAAGNSSNVAIQDWKLFTESFSIDGGKVAMATSAVPGGETVMDQHGPHLRGAAKLKKTPTAFWPSASDANLAT